MAEFQDKQIQYSPQSSPTLSGNAPNDDHADPEKCEAVLETIPPSDHIETVKAENEFAAHDDNDDTKREEVVKSPGKEQPIVLPSVAVSARRPSNEGGAKSNGYAESIILDGDDEEEEAEFSLPRIEVQASRGSGAAVGLPTWNSEFESLMLCRKCKPRKEIIAENAHPKCFGNVGAAGLSRVFTSGSFCPDLSSRSMAPKNTLKFPSVPAADWQTTSQSSPRDRVRPMERSRTIAAIPRRKRDIVKMPEIRASKLSLFSRGGDRAKNLQFGPAQSWNLDRTKSDLDGLRSVPRRITVRMSADPKLTEIEQITEKPPESESDELTPSETGMMGNKINDWFSTGRKPDPIKPKAQQKDSKSKKRRSKNLWDPGMHSRIHRGLASSMLKPNACIGNYLNDVTVSRFPRVETRQIVITR